MTRFDFERSAQAVDRLRPHPDAARTYLNDGRPYDAGETLRPGIRRRHTERDASLADLSLGPDEALSEGRLGQEEGARYLGRRQAADETQRQRHLCLRGEGGVAAGKDQLEPFVGNDCLLVLRELLGAGKELGLARERLLAADAVDRPVARRGHYPRARIRGDAVTRPSLGGSDEGVLHRVLGEVEVTEDAAEDRDRTRPLVAVRPLEAGMAELVYATV